MLNEAHDALSVFVLHKPSEHVAKLLKYFVEIYSKEINNNYRGKLFTL